jgi:hypothetical protein
LSQAVFEYCDMVEESTKRANETMPPLANPPLLIGTYADRRNLFSDHIANIKAQCASPSVWGDVVFALTTDNPSIISPPWVDGPVYNCTNSVVVRGVLPGATVELFVRDSSGSVSPLGTSTGGPLGGVTFSLLTPASTGEAYFALQSLAGVPSDLSLEETTVEYPESDLPQPRITQPAYECADKIGVHTQLQGVNARVWKDNPNAGFTPVSGTWSTFSPPQSPWTVGSIFHAETSLCSSNKSPTVSVTATALPNPLKSGKFWSPPNSSASEIYEGQQYLLIEDFDNGAYASITATQPASMALGNTESDPEGEVLVFDLDTSPLGRNAQLGDEFSAVTKFACASVTGPPIVSTPVLPCSSLPAPRIAFPRDGDRFVTVQDFVPGARIRVFRLSSGDEIADGAPPRVMLAPPNVLALGEPIRVVQQLGTCTGTQTFEVTPGAGQ